MKRLTHQEVKSYFADQGCILLEKEYINAKQKMSYICQCGNVSSINISNFKSGKRCAECMRMKLSAQRRKPAETASKYFSDAGCEMIGVYKNANEPIEYRCDCGRLAKISLANLRRGRRCRQCGINKISGKNHYNWCADRRRVEENLSIRKRCYLMLYYCLKAVGRKKTTKSRDILGYTGRQLQDHIRQHPNWTSVKDQDWEIDHIFPLKAFLDYGIKDLKLINCLENLAPLPTAVNRKKSKNYNRVDFERWVMEHIDFSEVE